MKIIATETTGRKLNPGDLFSTANQAYWDHCDLNNSVGEKVYIRTNTPINESQGPDDKLFKLEVVV